MHRSAQLPRAAARAGFLAAVFACGAASGARAQDVLREARGVAPPAALVARVEQQPERFEFRRVWREKTRRVRAARVQLERMQGLRLSMSALQGAGAALTGTLRVPVVLGTYAGFTPAYTPAQIQGRLFGSSSAGYTAKSYYQEISRGVFTLDGTVTPWYTLPQPASYYDPSAATDPTFGRIAEYLRDALAAVNPAFDWGQFDNDGPDGVPNSGDDDGYVDAATFIYPEAGKACGGPGIWPHRSTYSGWWGAPYTTTSAAHNGGFIKVDDYLVLGSVGCDKVSLMEIGTFAHEMGHGLGLPDLYDTYSPDGTGEGLGEWDLMASGSYRRESSPAHMSAWSKDFLGWVNVQTVTAPLTGYTLPPVYQVGTVLRYDLPFTREHLLLEHREATASDAYLHGPGLLVYHVDDAAIDSTVWSNRVNGHARQGVALMQADGLNQLGLGQNRGDAGDPFPGSAGRTSFTWATNPSSNDNGGFASGFGLQNVTLAGSALTFDLTVGPALRVLQTVNLTANPGGSTNSALGVNSTSGSLAAQAVSNAPWLSVTPVGTATPMSFSLTANTAGMAPGVHSATVTVSAPGAINSPVAVAYNITVGTSFLLPGDSVRSGLAQGKPDTIQLSLTSGARVDVGVWSESSSTAFAPRVAIVTPGGFKTSTTVVRTKPNGGIVAGYTAATTGTYRLIVTDAATAPNYAGQTMPYVVRTRASGPVLVVGAPDLWSYQRVGSGTPEHIATTVTNYGAGSGAFTVSADSAFITVSPGSGVAGAPPATATAAAAPGAAPAGTAVLDAAGSGTVAVAVRGAAPAPVGAATPVDVVFTAGSLAIGAHSGTVTYHLGSDVWNGDLALDAVLRLHDPAGEVIDTTRIPSPGYTALAPDGKLVMATDADLVKVDTATGAVSVWVAGIGYVSGAMQFGSDSALYLAIGLAKKVVRVAPDGTYATVATFTGTPRSVAVLPDRTLYVAVDGNLVRVAAGSSPTTVLTSTRSSFSPSLAYSGGWIYYAAGGTLRRFDPATGTDEARGAPFPAATNGTLIALAGGSSGTLYGVENSTVGSIFVLGTDGTIQGRLWAPGVGFGLSLGNGRLFGTALWPGSETWRLPVNDSAPPAVGLLVGDPSGDGKITSLDALGVLSTVVGKPLPAGWSAGLAADANCDGQVTAADALVILSAVVQKDVHAFCVGQRR